MNELDLITYFISLIRQLGYSVVEADLGIAAVVVPARRLVMINKRNVHIFDIAHEFAHIKLDHSGRLLSFEGNDERNPNEYAANVLAIEIIVRNHIDMGCMYNYVKIMEWYGIPPHLEDTLISVMTDLHPCAEQVYI
ncbi:ImmA/IrrE family metallo-endopeptidase [Weissella tructae]|uniref:ImmA/IrrE family metallo-endopeptidase n=1 Tax=Weissella tructae TaxID=887702 RepID=UPI003D8F1D78